MDSHERPRGLSDIKDAVFSRKTTGWSLKVDKKKTEAKIVYQNMRKKFCNSDAEYSRSPSPTHIITEMPPPRGKRAFLCAVTYKKQKCQLKGTVQDVKNMKALLIEQFNFSAESILILAEEEGYEAPTRTNIEDALQWLVKGIQPGDSLVFYFSGHGLRQRDFNGDEIDGFDETICPVDFQTKGMILDNYINRTIVGPLIPGVTLHAIIDSCHSGTVLDLPYVYNTSTGEWEDNNPPSGAYKGTNGGRAISFSACEDYQQAADTSAYSPEKEMTGAMTCTFIRAIKEAKTNNRKLTYQGIMDSMHQTLKQAHKSGCLSAGLRRIFHRRILQDPQLSSCQAFNPNTEFKL